MTANLLVSLLGLALFGKTIHIYFKRYTTKRDQASDSSNSTPCTYLNEVLFFPDRETPCLKILKGITKPIKERDRLCENISCRKLHNRIGESPSSLIKFLEYLSSARKSVDLCIYLFTQSSLADILVNLHRNGKVKIRIITDSSKDEGVNQIQRLRSNGIEVKGNKRGTGALMHHKFVIIDDEILLSGSFNWTQKAVVSNYEAVLVTREPGLVRPFGLKFEGMWADFGPYFDI